MRPSVFGFDLDRQGQTVEHITTLPIRVPVTGADAVNGVLAVSTVVGIYRFELPDELADLATAEPTFVRKLDPLMEAVAIDGETIWATTEQNLLRRFDAKAFE
ncbi:MAG: hypothetical protein AAGD32_16665 [Planctomycetota bacterium]